MNTVLRHPIHTGLAGALALTTLASSALALDFPERRELGARSRREGLGRREVTLYRRLAGPGRQDVAKRLQGRFGGASGPITTAGPFEVKQRKEQVVYIGAQGWTLRVWADGSRLSYRNPSVLRLKGRPVPSEQRLAPERLEDLGRQFIKTHLEDLVVLAPSEELVPLSAHYKVSGGGSTDEGARPDPEEVLANQVVFARSIEGSVVIGAGSKIAVLFTNDGDAVGFDVDWPQYESVGRTQAVLDVTEIRKRSTTLLPMPLTGPGVEIRRFECGYFDAGARRRDAEAPLQSACFIQAAQSRTADTPAATGAVEEGVTFTSAYASPIPAGVTVERDPRWPETLKVLGLRPPAGSTPPGAIPPATIAVP